MRARTTHLAGVQPVLEAWLGHSGNQELVHDVLGCRGQQRQGHTHTEHDKEAGEMLDAHLQCLVEEKEEVEGEHQKVGGCVGEGGREMRMVGEKNKCHGAV